MLNTKPFLICALLALSAPVLAQTPPASHDEETALGIAMETLPYPGPVDFLPLVNGGQDVRMAYMDLPARGQPNGKTVLLLHGRSLAGAAWGELIQHLNARGYRVVAPDQIGFGKSSKPDLNYSFDLLASNTIALLDHLRLGSVIVIGHSFGGMLAAHLAANYPDRVQRLVLEDALGLEDYRRYTAPRSLEQRYAQAMALTPGRLRADFHAQFAHESDQEAALIAPAVRMLRSAEYPRLARANALIDQMISQQPVLSELPRIAAPTLLIVGAADRFAPDRAYARGAQAQRMGDMPALHRAAAGAIQNARVVEIAEAGHMPHLEAPQAFDQALDGFLDDAQ